MLHRNDNKLASATIYAKRVARMPSPFISIFLVAFLSAAAVSRAADVVHDNGGSSLQDGWEMTQWFEADDFVLHDRTQVSEVKFWHYAFPGMFSGTVVWEIYTNSNANSPGALVASGSSMGVTNSATGRALFTSLQEFVTTFQINPVVLERGTYWLALHNGPRENVTRGMFWAPSITTTGAPSHSREALSNGVWYSNYFPGFPSDLAFQVFGTVVPRALGTSFVNGHPALRFTTTAGKYYRLQYKNNISDVSWLTVPGRETIVGTGSEVEVTDPQPDVRTRARRFYRVVLL
jgi:hypothetical protein